MLKTWDIFDTLIARRCIFPQAIFQIVEQVSKINDFAQARITAEQNLLSRKVNYNLDDIYNELHKITGAAKDACDVLKKLECEAELDQSIPITENIRQVRSGDILISDMYLPEEIIRRMLTKAGLFVPTEIIVTSGGKSSGRIWKQLAKQKEFVFHIGDNENGDMKNPRLAGFESALSVLSNFTTAERFLVEHDFNFAAYLREIRLRNPFSEEIKRMYWEFATINIGMLILLVLQIDELQKKCGFEYLGFCGRDVYYLRLLYERYKYDRGETPTPNDYLYYSRKLVRESGKETAKYFSSRIANRKALMIDLVGSGTHLNYLRKKYGFNYSILLCGYNGDDAGKAYTFDVKGPLDWISCSDERLSVNKNNLDIFVLNFMSLKDFFPNETLEPLNRAPHNSPVRLRTLKVDEKILPQATFSSINDTENFDVMEACFKEVFNSKIIWANNSSEELLMIFIQMMNSVFVQLPFRRQHQIIESIDIFMLKLSSNER